MMIASRASKSTWRALWFCILMWVSLTNHAMGFLRLDLSIGNADAFVTEVVADTLLERRAETPNSPGTLGSIITTQFHLLKLAQDRPIYNYDEPPILLEGISDTPRGPPSQTHLPKDHPVASNKPTWGSWKDYGKVSQGGREYAQVGDRLYTRHAVDRMQPSGLGFPAGADKAGRSIAPTFVDDVIQNGTTTTRIVDGVERTIHTSGSVQVVTEQGGKIVVTINPYSGGR